jgi:hypothetical protein
VVGTGSRRGERRCSLAAPPSHEIFLQRVDEHERLLRGDGANDRREPPELLLIPRHEDRSVPSGHGGVDGVGTAEAALGRKPGGLRCEAFVQGDPDLARKLLDRAAQYHAALRVILGPGDGA